MPASRSDLEDVVFDAILAAVTPFGLTDQSVIWRDQPRGDGEESAPQPDVPYLTLKFITGPRRIGNDDSVVMPPVDSPSVTALIVGQRELTLSVQAHGDIASDLVQAVSNYFQRPSQGGALRRAQTTTVQVNQADPSSDYALIVRYQGLTITSGPAPTLETIRDQLVAEVDALNKISASPDPSNVSRLLITGWPGDTFLVEVEARLEIVDTIQGVDIAFLSDNGEVDLSDIIDSTHFETRSAIDLLFVTDAVFDDPDVGVIETVEGPDGIIS